MHFFISIQFFISSSYLLPEYILLTPNAVHAVFAAELGKCTEYFNDVLKYQILIQYSALGTLTGKSYSIQCVSIRDRLSP